MPQAVNFNGNRSVPKTPGVGNPSGFIDGSSPVFEERNYNVTGVTRDSTGASLGSCVVKLFNSATDILEQSTTSDASGNYTFVVDKTKTWYIIAYKVGSPDISGTTINTVAGA